MNLVTVRTGIEDRGQLVEAFAPRVGGDRLILPWGEPIEPGAEVTFLIELNDGSVGFAGAGRCIESVQNEQAEHEDERFDVVLDSLALEDANAALFEAMLAQQTTSAEQPVDDAMTDVPADVAHGESDAASEAEAAAFAAAHPPIDSESSVVTEFHHASHTATLADAPVSPRMPTNAGMPPPRQPAPVVAPSTGFLRRAGRAFPWTPSELESNASMNPPGQFFQYGRGQLPTPAAPPTPEGGYRKVEAAPKPGANPPADSRGLPLSQVSTKNYDITGAEGTPPESADVEIE